MKEPGTCHFKKCSRPLIAMKWTITLIIIHIINSPHNFSVQNRPQNSDRVRLRFQSPRRCIIKHLKNTKLYSIEFLRTEMTSYSSYYHREYSYGSYSLFQFDRSDVIFVLKNLIEYSFVFSKCLIWPDSILGTFNRDSFRAQKFQTLMSSLFDNIWISNGRFR